MVPGASRRWSARRVVRREYTRRGLVLDRVSLKSTQGTDFLDALASRRVTLRPELVALDERGARFADGTRADADAIVLATGYRSEFPFLPEGVPERIDGALALYRLVFPPGVDGLAFVGMVRVSGPVFTVAELQARWVAAVFAGRVALPSADAMRREIDDRLARAHAVEDDQITVELVPY